MLVFVLLGTGNVFVHASARRCGALEYRGGGGGGGLERGCGGVCLCDDVNCDKYWNGEEEALDVVMLGDW